MGKLFKKYITIKSSLERNERSDFKGSGQNQSDEEEEKQEDIIKKDPKRGLAEAQDQMGENLNKLKQNTEKLESLEHKVVEMEQESGQMKSLAIQLKNKKSGFMGL